MTAGNARKKSPNLLESRRKGLLAVVHIAKKELGLTDGEYRAALSQFGAASAGAMSVPELESLADYFKTLGFRGKGRDAARQANGQAAALRARILAEAGNLENGAARLAGLVKKICGVDRLEWCRDAARLKQVLSTISAIARTEGTDA